MTTSNPRTRYWGYRIDVENIHFFQGELEEGRLRQGWGSKQEHDLLKPDTHPEVARHKRMFNEVKQGHILLVPRLPDWDWVSIVEATEDWDAGYHFEISKEHEDYGHIFPAKFLRKFRRSSKPVTGNIRSTLKNQHRFWNIDHYSVDIEKIRNAPDDQLDQDISDENRLMNAIEFAFAKVREDFSEELYDKLNTELNAKEWEDVLAVVMRSLYPRADVETVGSQKESKHGTDIKITIPGLSDKSYIIAVQVKDHERRTAEKVIEQINKASYWTKDSEKLIEKVVIITKAKKKDNSHLMTIGNKNNVKFVFEDNLKDILTKYAERRIGLDDSDHTVY